MGAGNDFLTDMLIKLVDFHDLPVLKKTHAKSGNSFFSVSLKIGM